MGSELVEGLHAEGRRGHYIPMSSDGTDGRKVRRGLEWLFPSEQWKLGDARDYLFIRPDSMTLKQIYPLD